MQISSSLPLPRVLVVEDDSDDRALFREAVEELGLDLDLSFAHDGAGLLRAVAGPDTRPDLVLLDLALPGTPGIELLRSLRASPTGRVLPVLVYTTSWAEVDIDRAYRAGANGFLIKPLRFDALLDLLDRTFAFWLGACQLPHPQAGPRGPH